MLDLDDLVHHDVAAADRASEWPVVLLQRTAIVAEALEVRRCYVHRFRERKAEHFFCRVIRHHPPAARRFDYRDRERRLLNHGDEPTVLGLSLLDELLALDARAALGGDVAEKYRESIGCAVHADLEPVAGRDLELERLDVLALHPVAEPGRELRRDVRAPQIPEIAAHYRWPVPLRQATSLAIELCDGPAAIEDDERIAHRVEHVGHTRSRTFRFHTLPGEIVRRRAQVLVRLFELDGLRLHLRRLGAELLIRGGQLGECSLPSLVSDLPRGECAAQHRVDEEREQTREQNGREDDDGGEHAEALFACFARFESHALGDLDIAHELSRLLHQLLSVIRPDHGIRPQESGRVVGVNRALELRELLGNYRGQRVQAPLLGSVRDLPACRGERAVHVRRCTDARLVDIGWSR